MALQTPTERHRESETDHAMALLQAGVPLTLLLDLATPVRSDDVYQTEHGSADWLPTAVVA